MDYREPELSYLILDFKKEREVRQCLESVKKHTKFPHKIIYLHNGNAETYPYELFKEGLIDQLIQTKDNTGLAIGTRDLFAASFSPYSLYLQNDQYLTRDFTQEEFDTIKQMIGTTYVSPEDGSHWVAMSVDLAGGMTGVHRYSERAHIIPTALYKKLEEVDKLNHRGAGPYDEAPWREAQIQDLYRERKWLHYTYNRPLVHDNGDFSVRENPDGSVWQHNVDTNGVRLLRGPVKEKFIYPAFTDEEWADILTTQNWPEWHVPKTRRRVS